MKRLHLKSIILLFMAIFTGVTFFACNDDDEKEERKNDLLTIRGVVNVISDPCHDCGIIIDVKNIDSIGLYGLWQCGCGQEIVLNNSIIIPFFWEWEGDSLTYTGEGKEKLKDFALGSEITMECKVADSTEKELFFYPAFCTSNHFSTLSPQYIVNKIINIKN